MEQSGFILKLKECFNNNNIELTPEQEEKFEVYYNMLLEWNQKFNLTTITQQDDVILKHFLDSVKSNFLIPHNSYVLDLGSGAGFPGIPLKILRPDLKIVLLDSVNKKILFLQEVIKSLKLCDAKAIHGRAEELAHKQDYREKFDIVVSRAVCKLNVLVEYCVPFLKIEGKLIAYKSQESEDEIAQSKNAIFALYIKISEVHDISFNDLVRKLVCVTKLQKTPNKFPRSGNKPRISPII